MKLASKALVGWVGETAVGWLSDRTGSQVEKDRQGPGRAGEAAMEVYRTDRAVAGWMKTAAAERRWC